MLWLIIPLIVCIALSGFFSASETAFSTMNRVRLKTIEGTKRKKAQLALKLGEDYDKLLMTILLGNNIVNIAGTAIATVFFTGLLMGDGDAGATVSTIVMTIVILIFGEISPKCLAKENAEGVAMALARPLAVVMKILSPLSYLFKEWKKLLSKVTRTQKGDSIIEAELITMVDEARDEGNMDDSESELIRSAIEFGDLDAQGIMTPRVDVTGIEDTATTDEIAEVFRNTAYSRLPVYHEDMDHIIGVLNEKDFNLMTYQGNDNIQEMMKPPVFAPLSVPIPNLLKLLQKEKSHMVILLDEFGGTEGIVTMEDILEELVGEIYDEHDDVDEAISTQEDGSVLFDGGVRLEELLEKYGIGEQFEADTVGGWTAEMLGKIPSAGDSFEYRGLHCEVTGMEKRRVTEVKINGELIEDEDDNDRG